jgi:hypothetical protein
LPILALRKSSVAYWILDTLDIGFVKEGEPAGNSGGLDFDGVF